MSVNQISCSATICACDPPKTILRKNVVVNPFVWITGFSDPNDLDFKGQKGKWEEAFNKKLSTFSALSEFLYGGVTILSMKQDEFSDTSIHVETEIVFGAEVK